MILHDARTPTSLALKPRSGLVWTLVDIPVSPAASKYVLNTKQCNIIIIIIILFYFGGGGCYQKTPPLYINREERAKRALAASCFFHTRGRFYLMFAFVFPRENCV